MKNLISTRIVLLMCSIAFSYNSEASTDTFRITGVSGGCGGDGSEELSVKNGLDAAKWQCTAAGRYPYRTSNWSIRDGEYTYTCGGYPIDVTSRWVEATASFVCTSMPH